MNDGADATSHTIEGCKIALKVSLGWWFDLLALKNRTAAHVASIIIFIDLFDHQRPILHDLYVGIADHRVIGIWIQIIRWFGSCPG